MPILFGIPYLAEVLFFGGTAVAASGVISSVADSAQKGAEASSRFMKEVVIPGALIYAAFVYYQSRKKA